MKKKYKALMLDLDGTTIQNYKDALPSKRVINAINKAKKKLAIGVITSRPPFWAKTAIKALHLTAPCIVIGGAQIIDPTTNKVIWEKRISSDEAENISKMLRELKIPFVGPKKTHKGKISPGYRMNIPKEGQTEIGIPDIDDATVKLLTKRLKIFKNIAVQRTLGYEDQKDWIQITNIDATKQYAVYEFAKILGIQTHEIIGVGDGYNDFPFLMACGLKVAMGNAVSELKEIADYIAPTIENDGVADVIEKFIL